MDSPTQANPTRTNSAPIVAETYLGNLHQNPTLASKINLAQPITIEINRQDCRKGRIFVKAKTGESVGIVKSRDWLLKDGDVMATQSQQRVIIQLQQQQVVAIRFSPSAQNQAVHLVYLGHVLGNHHWPITVQGHTLYVELVTDADIVKSAILEIAKMREIQGLSLSIETRNAEQFIPFEQAQIRHSHAHHHPH